MNTEYYQDWRAWLELLTEHRVRYALIGGLAMAEHGHPRYTKDMDLLIQNTPENAERVMRAMRDFGFGEIGITARDFTQPDVVIQLGYEPVRIDLITSIPGVDWEEVEAGLLERELAGVRVPVIGRRELVKAKRATGRPEDMADLHRLGEGSAAKELAD